MKLKKNWYIILDEIHRSGAENMAIDEFLFRRAHKAKSGYFRIYSWEKPTFSIGVSQKIKKVLNIDYIEKFGLNFVRRITGGKAVLHDREITYSVVSSESIFYRDNDLYKSYELIAGIILNALLKCGIKAVLSRGISPSRSKSNDPCFSFPTPNEIEVDGKKIVGSAQKRDKFALLQHGSIPFEMNYGIYAKGAGYHEALLRKSMTTVKSVSDISKSFFVEKFIKSFEEFLGFQLSVYEFSSEDIGEIKMLEDKYKSANWNYLL